MKIDSIRLEDQICQQLAEILRISEEDEHPGHPIAITFLGMPAYNMYVMYQKSPSTPGVMPGSPIRYSPDMFLRYISECAAQAQDVSYAWRLTSSLIATGQKHAVGRIVYLNRHIQADELAACIGLPADIVREFMANHLTFIPES